jgi:hypothetical protein
MIVRVAALSALNLLNRQIQAKLKYMNLSPADAGAKT